MTDDLNWTPRHGLVNAEERGLIADAISLARGSLADPSEVDAVVEWVARTRADYVLSVGVLEGLLVVWMDAGKPVFRRVTRRRPS